MYFIFYGLNRWKIQFSHKKKRPKQQINSLLLSGIHIIHKIKPDSLVPGPSSSICGFLSSQPHSLFPRPQSQGTCWFFPWSIIPIGEGLFPFISASAPESSHTFPCFTHPQAEPSLCYSTDHRTKAMPNSSQKTLSCLRTDSALCPPSTEPDRGRWAIKAE